MATGKAVPAEDKFARTEIDAAVDDTLADDDLWNDLVTSNPVPPLKIKGLIIPQPTKAQVDAWSANPNDPDADKILMGDELYAKVQDLFAKLPLSAYRNFQREYMSRMFGVADVGELGK